MSDLVTNNCPQASEPEGTAHWIFESKNINYYEQLHGLNKCDSRRPVSLED